MDGFVDEVTLEEFKIFYGIDRELYTVLVRDLSHNPFECLQIMGFWLWLERGGGYCNLVSKILSLEPLLIDRAYDEALVCIQLVISDHLPVPSPGTSDGVPLTRRLLRAEFSLQYFRENRDVIFHYVQNLVSDVYIPALSDIMERAWDGLLGPGRNQTLAPTQTAPVIRVSTLEDAGWDCLDMSKVPSSARTMFMTFSKGYPVTEVEVREFFTRLFGNCIESLYMQEVGSEKQALYARIVFVNPSYIQSILNGETKAKFSINGKHVWMRQFVPRNGRMWACGCCPAWVPRQFVPTTTTTTTCTTG